MKDWKLEPARDLDLPLGERARSLERENTLLESTLQWFWWTATRCYLRVWHRLRVEGRANLPAAAPFVLVANHCGHLDILALAAALPARLRARLFPIAAGDHFFETPVLSTFAAFVLNGLPLWRKRAGRQALDALRARLVEGDSAYAIFPEGTRSRTGEMATFKPGIGMLVAGTRVQLVPCHITGSFAALPPHRRLPRPRRLRLRIGVPLTFEETACDRDGFGEVARRAEAAVRALARGQA